MPYVKPKIKNTSNKFSRPRLRPKTSSLDSDAKIIIKVTTPHIIPAIHALLIALEDFSYSLSGKRGLPIVEVLKLYPQSQISPVSGFINPLFGHFFILSPNVSEMRRRFWVL
jgi:hypothetical protein